jgi:hypothetical protein
VDHPRPIPLPSVIALEADRALTELLAGIELVRRGLATRVHVTGLAGLEEIAARALVRAQAAGVRFTLNRDAPDSVSATIGPAV